MFNRNNVYRKTCLKKMCAKIKYVHGVGKLCDVVVVDMVDRLIVS